MAAPQTQDTRVLAKRTGDALDRLAQVEKTLPNIISAVNNAFGRMDGQLNSQGEVLEAVVALLGMDTVQAKIKETREAKATAAMEQEKAALEELVKNGDVALVEKIGDKALIVGREYNPDGTVRHPGRAQVAFQRVDVQFQPTLRDQKAGFTFDLPNGGKFEVVEVYEVVEKPEAAQPAAEAPPEATTTAAEPSATTPEAQ